MPLSQDHRTKLETHAAKLQVLLTKINPESFTEEIGQECGQIGLKIAALLSQIIASSPKINAEYGIDITLSGKPGLLLEAVSIYGESRNFTAEEAADTGRKLDLPQLNTTKRLGNYLISNVYILAQSVYRDIIAILAKAKAQDTPQNGEESDPLSSEQIKSILDLTESLSFFATEFQETSNFSLEELAQKRSDILAIISQFINLKSYGSLGRKLNHDLGGNFPLTVNGLFFNLKHILEADETEKIRICAELQVSPMDLSPLYKKISSTLQVIVLMINTLVLEHSSASQESIGTLKTNVQINSLFESVAEISKLMPEFVNLEIEFDAVTLVKTAIVYINTGDFMSFILNALRNSIKHGGAKNVVIRARREREVILFSIEDNGRGVSEERIPDIDLIFTEGFTTDGTGLGLRNMASRFVAYRAAHHGGLENEQGSRGMKIEVAVPLTSALN